jgi:hypothetical protein
MHWFQEWLEKGDGKDWYYIMGVVAFNFIWTFFAWEIFSFLGADMSSMLEGTIKMMKPELIHVVIFTIFLEEIIFRLFPILIAKKVGLTTRGILIVSVISSVIFGYIHGSMACKIFFQGVYGFLFCILFLKCGGLRLNGLKAFKASFSAHVIYDAIIFFLIIFAF